MEKERPRRRETYSTGSGGGAHRRGEGLGTGPVGGSGGSSGGGSGSGGRPGGNRMMTRGAGISLPIIIIAVIFMFMRGFGSSSPDSSGGLSNSGSNNQTGNSSYSSSGSNVGGGSFGSFGSGSSSGGSWSTGSSGSGGSTYGSWANSSYGASSQNTGSSSAVNASVSGGAREKYTTIRGNGRDVVTIMIYLCGTDLESQSGMATSDLQEMVNADIADNVNVIVYTGGCRRWNNNIFSTSVNQIYQVKKGGVELLVDNAGSDSMVLPGTLSSFIKYCAQNFPADRNDLIFWDHGGGSVSGYGYDEKNAHAGAMDLSEINTALRDGGVKFDFIGFDACLMGTAENALMLSNHGDYLIASEEVEPGTGWYYTNWLTALSRNTSTPTLDIGKQIIDDYVSACARVGQAQQLTLSITDLAELSATVPSRLAAFARSISKMITNKQYAEVSAARNKTREYAKSTRIDQIDLTHFALNINNSEGKELANAVMGAVKYNYAARAMTNSYGLAIYFPYQRAKYVDSMCNTYDAIGMDDSYAKCIREFAGLQVSGQVSGGGTNSPFESLFNALGGGSYGSGSYGSSSGSSSGSYGGGAGWGSLLGSGSGSSYGGGSSDSAGISSLTDLLGGGGLSGLTDLLGGGTSLSSQAGSSGLSSLTESGSLLGSSGGSSDVISQLLGSFLGGGFSSVSGLDSSNTNFLFGRSMSTEDTVEYLSEHYFDPSALVWEEGEDGTAVLKLDEDQWDLVSSIDLNMFYDDGEGYIDLGIDNIYDFDDDGNLLADTSRKWLTIDGHTVAYYHMFTDDDGENYSIVGRVPAMLNGVRVNLILIFDNDNPRGYVAGATTDYAEDETLTSGKMLEQLKPGDTLDFLCDFYTYEGQYSDSYYLGEQMTVGDSITISSEDVGDGSVLLTYLFKDIYNQVYWTKSLVR